jgi:hypothetical protein
MFALTLLAVAVTFVAASRWGPGHHLDFAERVYRRRKELLPRNVAELLEEERDAYDYGNLAADIINFKAFGGAYSHCHRWKILEEMRALSTSRRQKRSSSYLSHLAADTIAHNHFVPLPPRALRADERSRASLLEMNADRSCRKSAGRVTELKNRASSTS